jgi:hypothetical protein
LKRGLPILLFVLLSCVDKKLNERKFKFGNIEISRYQISLITSIHDHVDVIKDGETEHILKVNTGNIDTILLINDTLLIKTFRHPVIYEKKDKVFKYFIKIDSMPSLVNDTIYGQQDHAEEVSNNLTMLKKEARKSWENNGFGSPPCLLY